MQINNCLRIFFVHFMVTHANSQLNAQQFLKSTLKFLSEGGERLDKELLDQPHVLVEYDFIIVGAGSAGCVLGNRLTENPNWKVLLIEAGGNENLLMDIPILSNYFQQLQTNWKFMTEPQEHSCLALNNHQSHWPRGKVMGGTSTLNYMIYTRGNPRNYNLWEEMGAEGWAWEGVEPYFKKLESYNIPGVEPGTHGTNGPIPITYYGWYSRVSSAFVGAGVESGEEFLDYNGRQQKGYSFIQSSTNNGARMSTNVAYLYPIKHRKNLHVKKNSLVTKVLMNSDNRAVGVEFSNNFKTYRVYVRNEVILSAGTINSPQILMLSGIGPSRHLASFGIQPLIDLPVGYNLIDHVAPGITFFVNSTTLNTNWLLPEFQKYFAERQGAITSSGAEGISFLDSGHPDSIPGMPDLELLQFSGSIAADPVYSINLGIKKEVFQKYYGTIVDANSFTITPMALHPRSRGRITLKSKNPFMHPRIDPKYFTDPYDMEVTIRGIRKAIDLMDTEAFRKISGRLYEAKMPGCEHLTFNTDIYWECFTRHFTFGIYHLCGTCKMGSVKDPSTVVDSRLRVHGVQGLRVIDASIMPDVISGHTNAPAIMIGEKGADMIKEDWEVAL